MELRGTILSLPLKVSAPEFEGSFSLILHFVCMSPRPGRIVGYSEVEAVRLLYSTEACPEACPTCETSETASGRG